MNKISLDSVSKILKGKLSGNKKILVSEIIIDSRSLTTSSEQLFFALTGKNNNGHLFIPNLYERGIKNFIVSEMRNSYKNLTDANFILVPDTLKALHKLGHYYRTQFKKPLITLVGSNGKTIVKEWLFQLLKNDYKIVRSPKSYNSQTGVPLSLSLLDNKYDFAFIEAGISKKGEMQKLEAIVKPDIGIFVSFGQAHQENFSDMKEKAEEKMQMMNEVKSIIYSSDYKEVTDVISTNKKYDNKNNFTWSVNNKNTNLYRKSIRKNHNSSEIITVHENKEITYQIPFVDEASVKNSMVCLSFLLSQNLLTDNILKRFASLEPVEMRIEQKQGINNCLLINDSYNSDVISLKIALDTLEYQSVYKDRTLILSDIYQSGIEDAVLYQEVAEFVKAAKITKFIGIGKSISKHKHYFTDIKSSFFYPSTLQFLNTFSKHSFRNENILLKGSRYFKFEQISDILQLKKHRTILEINTEAVVHNLNYYKSLLTKNTKITVMVKALSYGSGTYEIAKLLQHHKVDCLGVAFTDEGVKLRNAGITTDIIVMNPDEDGFTDIIDYNLEPEIYGFHILNAFAKKTETYTGKKMPVHIKMDTGMKRLGFCDYEIDELIQQLKNYPQIYVKTIFSHLAVSDEPDNDEFTKQQISKFKKISKKIISELGYPVDRHILNSSGIERFPEANFEMVRLGIGLYGFGFNQDKLMNVSTLKTQILQIKKVKKGETVGYGRKWTANKDTKIAILPLGYADGFSRALSNGVGEVLIKNIKVPIIGNVCMDMCMADIGSLNAEEGDEVIIFGDEFPASEIAKKLNTIPYEIISGISERVKRIYLG